MSGEESDLDTSFLSQRSVSSYDYEADDESYEKIKNELPELVQQGTIHGIIKDSPQEELPALTKQEEKEDIEADQQATQTVDNLEIEIVDEIPEVRKSERFRTPSQKLKESLEPPPVIIKVTRKKKPVKKTTLFESSQEVGTQEAKTSFESEAESEASIAKVLIEKKIRLETRKPDDQAKAIYSDAELTELKKAPCYLCGFQFKDRISVKHNERWGYPLDQITSSYDHTPPINFSFTVSRIPSQYYTLEEYEKNYLKVNGKLACFHCNYTKSQLMFITCPKDDQGNIDFQKFQSNTEVIGKFVDDLYASQSEWCIGPDGKNTLIKCISESKKYKGDANQWIADRLASISASADEVCNMIKNNVSQTNVTKRFYYIKLLIQKAKDLLKVDEYMNNEANIERRKQRYAKKFIAHFVAKAEGTDKRFVKPWKTATKVQIRSSAKISPKKGSVKTLQTIHEEGKIQKVTNIRQTARNKVTDQKRGFNGSSRKRKTYRRKRLF